jgi:leucyl/phenylalanyl-tRNA--protein transferase
MSRHSPASRTIDTEFLLMAYCNGYFPMADPKTGEIGWFSPDPRAIFELHEFHLPRSLKLLINKNLFEIRIDTQFEEVMRLCGAREETWISEDIIQSYLQLHRAGFAHSLEVWRDGKLAGGLYGVTVGAAFFGESMFSRVRDASKVALAGLVERLRQQGFELLDTQWMTPHLKMLGAKEISREEYLRRLKAALSKKSSFS